MERSKLLVSIGYNAKNGRVVSDVTLDVLTTMAKLNYQSPRPHGFNQLLQANMVGALTAENDFPSIERLETDLKGIKGIALKFIEVAPLPIFRKEFV